MVDANATTVQWIDHDEPEARGRSADPSSRHVTPTADFDSETTAIASPAARRPAGDRPFAGPMIALAPEPIIEAQELLGADTPDLSTDDLAIRFSFRVRPSLPRRGARITFLGRAPTPCPLGVIRKSRQPSLRERPTSSKKSKACPRPIYASLICANAFPTTARKPTCSAVKP
jgi:hypothetical protein